MIMIIIIVDNDRSCDEKNLRYSDSDNNTEDSDHVNVHVENRDCLCFLLLGQK